MVPIEDEPTQVLLRLYGDGTKDNDIALQIDIFNILSQKGLGPKLYGKFDDGRLEEFLPANSLTCDELRNHDISLIIAKKLANIHMLEVPVDKQDSWVLDKLSEWSDQLVDLDELDQLELSESSRETAKQLLSIDFKGEIDFLRQVFEYVNSPKVFSHNDLHQGNILLAKKSRRRPTLGERVILIDFEYCSSNYRAYDIANHFTEWVFEYGTDQYPHFNYFQDRFPSEMNQQSFIREYLLEQRKLNPNEATKAAIKVSNQCKKPIQGTTMDNDYHNNHKSSSFDCTGTNGNHAKEPSQNGIDSNGFSSSNEKDMQDVWDLELQVGRLYAEVQPFYMAVNLLWAIWAIKNSRGSSIKFGYFEHAMTRWRMYCNFKKLYPQMNRNSFQMLVIDKAEIGWGQSIQTH